MPENLTPWDSWREGGQEGDSTASNLDDEDREIDRSFRPPIDLMALGCMADVLREYGYSVSMAVLVRAVERYREAEVSS